MVAFIKNLSPSSRRQLFTLVALLAVLSVFLWLACSAGNAPGQESSEDASAGSFLSISEDEVRTVEWTYEGTTSSIAAENGTWVSSAKPDAALDQSSADSLVTALIDATIERTLSAGSVSDADAGLDDPAWHAVVTLADDSEITLSIGGAAGSEESYYAKKSGDDAVYVIDSNLATELSRTVNDLYVRETAPGASTVRSLTLQAEDRMLTLSYDESGWDEFYTEEFCWKAEDGNGIVVAADSTEASSLASIVNHVTWSSVIDPLANDVSAYGLDEPTLTATLVYEDDASASESTSDPEEGEASESAADSPATATFVLEIGTETTAGDYYARVQGSQAVYTLNGNDVEALRTATPEALQSDEVCLMDWDTVDSIDMTVDGTVKTIAFSRSADSAEEGADVTTTYTVDGTEADASVVEELLSAIRGLEAESEASGSPASNSPELSIVFHRSSASFSEMTLSFQRYDNSFYLVSFDGQSRLLVNRNDVADIESLARNL